ncbi:hypothetical protein [Vagococcus hydrophili]|uniref:Uncharacterized protein n=1 Tax=Vagococcus hydrophili TaxID=2714947 RepID=A0A6G8ARV9_9ENTE|nr:hypothetical protein [Vagococcus hydrophili]QIL47818.1 hypothetical protein G7082_04300 [Vagococcus hydrophili]
MLQDYLYIHLDAISNSILAKGMTHEDFNRYTINRPENLLLLNPYENEGEYESHTGFRVVKGFKEVDRYFSMMEAKNQRELKWIDFKEYDTLKRLTPNEISELLYFGHMKNQLRSPFFYQLQNSFAFFELNQKTIKVYYRKIDEFYQTLARKISFLTYQQIDSNRSFFKKKSEAISELPDDLVVELKSVMQEGIVFNFSQVGLIDGKYSIPIHVVEDNLRKVDNYYFKQEFQIGTLIYSKESQSWKIINEKYDSLFMNQ